MDKPENNSGTSSVSLKFQEIEVRPDDPFKEDLLIRRETAKHLTSLINQLDQGGTVFVDAEWGQGKTTFLKRPSGDGVSLHWFFGRFVQSLGHQTDPFGRKSGFDHPTTILWNPAQRRKSHVQ